MMTANFRDLGLVELDGLSIAQALKQLGRELAAAGMFGALRRHEYHVKPAERQRMKHRRELARRRKALRRAEARRAERRLELWSSWNVGGGTGSLEPTRILTIPHHLDDTDREFLRCAAR
jgi:hypothetical protein